MHILKRYIKLTVYFGLYYSGFLFLLIIVYKKLKKKHPAIILFYHRFSQNNKEEIPTKLHEIIFKKQIKHLMRWYNIISLDELVDSLKSNQSLEKPSIVITIDDGFYDNYQIAYPILKRYQLPATIYLATGFIGTDRAPWIDEIAYALNGYHENTVQFDEFFSGKTFDISSFRNKYKLWYGIYEKLLNLEHSTKINLVNQILKKLEYKQESKQRFMLNWPEVNEMSDTHISFGAHTVSHPTLSKMPFKKANLEIRESKKTIEEKIGSTVRHFAIPNGRDEDFTSELLEFCKNEGFESVVTTNHGRVDKYSNLYSLPRFFPHDRLYVFVNELARLFILGPSKS